MSHIEKEKPEVQAGKSDNWIVAQLKQQGVVVFMAICFGLYTFVWNSHDSEKDLIYRVAALEKGAEKSLLADKEQTETLNQFVIALTKISEAQSRMAQDIKEIRDQQQKNTEMLFNRK